MAKVNLGTEPGKKPKKNKVLTGTRPRYLDGQTVKGGTDVRARRRLKRTGPIKGVDTSDGITGGEARKIKRVSANQPAKKRPQPKRNATPRQPADPYRSQVNSLAQLQFGPQERQLSERRAQEQQFGVNQQGYYAQHQQDMLLAQTKLQAYQQGVQAASYGAAQNAATTDQTQNNTMLQQAQASAAQRGTTVDPSLAGTLNAGVAARQVMGNAGGDLIGAQGQANAAYGVNQMQQAGEQGIQAQQDTQNRQRKIDQLAADLLSDKGAFKIKTKADLQAADHKSALEDAAFGVSTQNTLADNRRADRTERRSARDQRADNRRLRQQDAETRRSHRANERNSRRTENRMRAKDLADDGKLNGSTGTKTPANAGAPRKSWTHGDRESYDNAVVNLRQKDKKYGYTSADRQQVIDGLVKSGMTREVARSAWIRFMRSKRKRSIRPQTGTPVG